MRYAFTGEKMEREQFEHFQAIEWPLDDYYARVDRARKAYAAQVRGGAKGGKAKAQNATPPTKAKQEAVERAERANVVHPTKLEFKAIAKHFEADLDFDDYELNEFYEELSESGWKIDGEPITHRSTITEAISIRFNSEPYFDSALIDWNCFVMLFSGSHGNDDLLYDFAQTYEECTDGKGRWFMNGKAYTTPRTAVDAFLATLADEEAPIRLPKPP
jgi:hypothetical protein